MAEKGDKGGGPPDHGNALEAWERGELGPKAPENTDESDDEELDLSALPGDADGYVAPPPRPYPPNVFVVLALGCAILAAEPTADLSYTLFGPKTAVDLGEPGDYHLDLAQDDLYVKAGGILGSRYASYSRFGSDYEVRQMLGTAVLVRRPPRTEQLGKDVVERWTGEGRLVKLGDQPAGFVERLLRPNSRYSTLRSQFAAYGELPAGRDAYLILEGDVPRARVMPILLPFVLWALAAAAVYGAIRAVRLREKRREVLAKLRRMS